jgi:putative chitinase
MGVKKLNLKAILKSLKLNESSISMFLGAIVIVVVGVLVINYFKDQGASLPFLSTGEEEVTLEKPGTYTVKTGDNLWKIAEDIYGSGYNWVDIAAENNLAEPGLINQGQVLNLPDVEAQMATTKIEPQLSDIVEPITGGTYNVAKGDSLWEIAVRAYGDGYRWSEIARENELVNPNLIHSGNILVLPR